MPQPAADNIVEFRSVALRIGERPILNGITFSVARGETVVLLGRSGSGKTTLLRCVNRLIEPTSGEVVFEGRSTRDWDPVELRRKIGYVIQDAGLFPHFSVERNVAVVPRLQRWEDTRITERVGTLLTAVGLAPEEYARRYPRQLSGGQRQRVGIARALAADPAMLLMDEPFGALDPITRLELQRHFRQLRTSLGKTALLVTHDVREALMMASRIVLMKNGSVDVIATPEEFLRTTSPEAREFLAGIQDECDHIGDTNGSGPRS